MHADHAYFSQCTFRNSSPAMCCAMCDTPKFIPDFGIASSAASEAASPARSWQCSHCTLINSHATPFCVACNAPNPTITTAMCLGVPRSPSRPLGCGAAQPPRLAATTMSGSVPVWQWLNPRGSWRLYKDEPALALEQSWRKGSPVVHIMSCVR